MPECPKKLSILSLEAFLFPVPPLQQPLASLGTELNDQND